MGFEKKKFDDDVGKKNREKSKKDKKAMYRISVVGRGMCNIGLKYSFISPKISVSENKSIQLELLESQYIELRNNRSLKIQKIGA